MKCVNHPDVETSVVCAVCGNPICFDCSTKIKGKEYCPKCVENELSSVNVSEAYGGGGGWV
ncbi:MAG: hypothetical protein SVM80_10710 [Halobacteriota archaeon]|nr:hypothetical protein [Halobacteriota archaeon]